MNFRRFINIILCAFLLISIVSACSHTEEHDDKKVTVKIDFSINDSGDMTVTSNSAESITEELIADTTVERGTGKPVTVTYIFNSEAEEEAIMRLTNGGNTEPFGYKISSAVVTLNGTDIFTQSDFSQEIEILEADITILEGENILDVTLNSKPGAKFSIELLREIEEVTEDGGEQE